MRPGPKPCVDESWWVPASDDQAEQLFVALVRDGVRSDVAARIVGDLSALPRTSVRDANLRNRLRRYRPRLASLGPPPWETVDPPPSLRLSVLMGRKPTGAIGGWVKRRSLPAPIVRLGMAA